MAKAKKQPTPQEIYWARKQREEEEKDALLPPGLVNHGNTCFMNSTLQGVSASAIAAQASTGSLFFPVFSLCVHESIPNYFLIHERRQRILT